MIWKLYDFISYWKPIKPYLFNLNSLFLSRSGDLPSPVDLHPRIRRIREQEEVRHRRLQSWCRGARRRLCSSQFPSRAAVLEECHRRLLISTVGRSATGSPKFSSGRSKVKVLEFGLAASERWRSSLFNLIEEYFNSLNHHAMTRWIPCLVGGMPHVWSPWPWDQVAEGLQADGVGQSQGMFRDDGLDPDLTLLTSRRLVCGQYG